MADQSMRFLIEANSDAAIAQIKRAIDAVYGLGNASLTVNKDAADAYRRTQAATDALANATAAAAARVRSAYEAEKAALDPLYASTRRYEQAVQTMNAAVEAGVVQQAEANRVIAMAEQRYLSAGRAATTMAAEAGNVASGSRNVGFAVQNAAFQIGDFAVQVAAGTSAMRAAAMQVPQLLGGFGLWGAVIGGAVAVLSALVPMLFETGDKAEEAGKRVNEFTSALGSYSSYTKLALSDTQALREKFGEFAEEMRRNSQYMAQVSLAEARQAMGTNAADMIADLDRVAQAQKNASDAATYYLKIKDQVAQGLGSDVDVQNALDNYGVMRAKVDELAAAMGLTADQATRIRSAMANVDMNSSVEDIARSSQAVLDVFQEIFDAGQSLPEPLLKTYKSMNAIHEAAVLAVNASKDLKGELNASTEAAVKMAEELWNGVTGAFGLSDAAPKEGWLSGAINDAVTLAGKLWDAVKAKAAMGVPSDVVSQYAAYGQGAREMRLATNPLYNPPAPTQPVQGPSSGSGGGGGGASPRDTLSDLEDAGQKALRSMEMAVKGIDEKVKAGLMSAAEGADAVAQAKQKTADTLAELIPQMEAIGTPQATKFASAWRSAIGEMSDGLSAAGRKLSDQLSGNFETAFASFISGASSGKDAFASFAQSVLNDLAKIAAQRFTARFVSPIFDSILGGFGLGGGAPVAAAKGRAFAGAEVMAFAKGGIPHPPLSFYGSSIVERPTFFAMGGTKTGLMGEAGPEAIMPLARGRDGKLGVAMQGAGGAGVTVNVINNAGAEVTQTRRNENGADVIDVLIEQSRGAVVDDIRRGGAVSDALAATFGLQRRGY